jgi:hypothetical protein
MGNVLRVLGIVAASMLLGLAALVLVLFTICGGLESSEGTGILAVCLLLMAGALGLIVFLGGGLATSRSATSGLAVRPAVAPGAMAAGAVLPLRPLAGTDQQVLIGLRVALVVYILLSIGSIALNVANFSRFGSGVAIQLILRNILGVLPPAAVLVAVSIRTPPAPLALDAAAGLGLASILFRVGFVAFSGLLSSTLTQTPDLTSLFLRLGLFSALEAGIAGLAIHLRSRIAPMNPVALIVATVAFLFWDALIQAAMQALTALTL